ncbi:MAG TPA: iron-sulfur cluster assembly protein, partial [Candidatus Limnocylindrales bacterium]
MSEAGTHLAIARARSGLGEAAMAAPADLPDEAAVRAALAMVPDPELPIVSIDDLGMIERVAVDASGIRVTILPTFVGCPAIDMIRSAIGGALAGFDRPVVVATAYDPPWTSDRITEAGRAALAAAGIA